MSLPSLANVRYTHDAIIDEILLNPSVSQGDLSRQFGFSQSWMSIVINSDAFQNALAERKAELVDPKITATINERLEAVAKRSLDKILERLDSGVTPKDADLVAMAKLGVGDKNMRAPGPVVNNNLYVVQAPLPAQNSSTWLEGSSVGVKPPGVLPLVQEVARG